MAIKCPKCHSENPDTLKFCGECGAQLPLHIRTAYNKNNKAPEVKENKVSYKGRSIFQLNYPINEPWISTIGSLMVNFGALEYAVYVWISRLAKDEFLHYLSVEMHFARRLELLKKLVDRQDMPRELKSKIKSVYKKIERLSELRNTVAHNPLVFGWHDPHESGPPDFMGIPNIKRLKYKKPSVVPLINLKDLKTANDELTSLAQFLESAFVDLPNLPPKKNKSRI